MKRLKSLFALALLTGAAGCGPPTSEDAGEAAGAYAEEHWPGSTMGPDGNTMAPVVTDEGETWHVTFQLPKGWTGKTPVIDMSKTDLEVVKAYDPQSKQQN